MKILLAIIITATFSFGCAILEGEQTTTDSGGGGTTSAPTGGGESTPTAAVTGQRISAGGEAQAGGQHTCAITANGTAQCWGSDSNGQSTVPFDLGSVSSISAGSCSTVRSKPMEQPNAGAAAKVLCPLILDR